MLPMVMYESLTRKLKLTYREIFLSGEDDVKDFLNLPENPTNHTSQELVKKNRNRSDILINKLCVYKLEIGTRISMAIIWCF